MDRLTASRWAGVAIASGFAVASTALPTTARAQAVQQKVHPPVAQAWIDVATFGGLGMPMGGPGGGGLGAIAGLLGRGDGGEKNTFGRTQATGSTGRWVDITVATRNNPSLAEAAQAVPPGFLSPALQLVSPQQAPARPVPDSDDEVVSEPDPERPKGRVLLYWGCGDTVRSGQPRVLDAASATPQDFARFFQSRRATQRGAHAQPGRPIWPNPTDARMVPAGASLAGEHAIRGSGIPEGFRFAIPAAQDLMPALELQQSDNGGASALQWNAAPTARAYFVAAMGGGERDEMVLWTSSELPEVGLGLVDYQTNAAVDRWVREKVLLPPSTTRCTVPKGVFPGEGAMLRLIGYGSELHLAHPPRPADPKVDWKPDWAVRIRVKSVTTAMLGMASPGATPPTTETEAPQQPAARPEDKKLKPLDLLKGILGR